MSYSVTYNKEEDYVFVTIEGELNLSFFDSMAAEVAQCLNENNCKRILNDVRNARPAKSIVDIHTMPDIAIKAGITRSVKRALVISKPASNFRFLETVFINQGNRVKLFDNIDDAKLWLIEK